MTKGLILKLLILLTTFAPKLTEARELIPQDPKLVHGVLGNGMQYYIKHNDRPKGQADFYILSDVGAIQEDEDQQGLAHFLEHMAFNGTQNLKGKKIIDYLESVGVKFGANLNASTGFDSTTYMMTDLPTERQIVVDSALLILREWAGNITPSEEEIDKERGVIKEELRTRDGASWRSMISLIKTLGRGTRYENRNIIGSLEGLDSFKKESLVRFYKEWYRPEHQAIIVVGDVDIEHVETEIKRLFSSIPASPTLAKQKDIIFVEENKEPVVNVFVDKEMQYSSIQYFMTRQAPKREDSNTVDAFKCLIEDLLITHIQNERFNELTLKPNAPILHGEMSVGRVGVIPTLSATTFSVQSPEGGLENALFSLVQQIERMQRYGFTQAEFERAKLNLIRGAEQQYINRKDRVNSQFVQRYISNYRFGEAIPSAESEWEIDKKLIDETSLEDINERLKVIMHDENNVLMLTTPEKEGLEIPSSERVLAIIDEVRSSEISKPKLEEISRDLIAKDKIPTPGAILKTKVDDKLGTTEWLLSNGVKVIVKPTTLKADEVILRANSRGGLSRINDADYYAGQILGSLLSASGLGEFNNVELSRVLSGKIAWLNSWFTDYSHGINGACSPADLLTLMQLVYLNFNAPRLGISEFETLKRQLRANIENNMSDPDYQLAKKFSELAYNNNHRRQSLTVEIIDSIDFDSFERVRAALMSDADNFTFTIVGSVDLETLKPLVEQYLATLPSTTNNKEMTHSGEYIKPVEGKRSENFKTAMTQPKAGVRMLITGDDIKFNMRNLVVTRYLEAAFDTKLLESVREELGGTYGVKASLNLSNKPKNYYSLSISYDTNAEQVAQLQAAVMDQLKQLAEEGCSEEQIAKTREYLTKNFANSKEHNSSWIRYISAIRTLKLDYLGEYMKHVNNVTPRDIQKMAQHILAGKNRIEMIMLPEE